MLSKISVWCLICLFFGGGVFDFRVGSLWFLIGEGYSVSGLVCNPPCALTSLLFPSRWNGINTTYSANFPRGNTTHLFGNPSAITVSFTLSVCFPPMRIFCVRVGWGVGLSAVGSRGLGLLVQARCALLYYQHEVFYSQHNFFDYGFVRMFRT